MAFEVSNSTNINLYTGDAAVTKLTPIDVVVNETYDIRATVGMEITCKVEGDKHVVTEESQSALSAKVWESKFYQDNYGNVRFTRNQALLAIVEIMKAIKNEKVIAELEKKTVDLEVLLKQPFKVALVIIEEKGLKFIDWSETMKLNGAEIPTLEPKASDNTKLIEDTLVDESDSDLPF